MKKIACILIFALLLGMLGGCTQSPSQVVATTLPVYEFTVALCAGTDITVARLVTENVSCLHDYTLQVKQMRMLESADTVVISGAGLEGFLGDALLRASHIIDASEGIALHCSEMEDEHAGHGHSHAHDPHIWLSPENAKHMANCIYSGLIQHYPDHAADFDRNLQLLLQQLDDLQTYADTQLAPLSTRELITFHDGFSYFAEAFDLHILHTVEEESGSEASAAELKELIGLVRQNALPAVFVEVNGSGSAAQVVAAETGVRVYSLDMAMSGDSYFDAMIRNIDTLKEALE